ncbi:MAG: prepilin-type N-terminal cleavage/methylation domain-containing protein [Planctomycetota bacterium]
MTRRVPQSRAARGFSLVELLAATALAALVLVGLIRVTASLSASVRADTPAAHIGDALRRAAALIEADLRQARYQRAPDPTSATPTLGLVGHLTQSDGPANFGERTFHPGVVTYRLREVDGQACLFRSQRGVLPGERETNTLLLVGVAGWRIDFAEYRTPGRTLRNIESQDAADVTEQETDPLARLDERLVKLRPIARLEIAMSEQAGGARLERTWVLNGGAP